MHLFKLYSTNMSASKNLSREEDTLKEKGKSCRKGYYDFRCHCLCLHFATLSNGRTPIPAPALLMSDAVLRTCDSTTCVRV